MNKNLKRLIAIGTLTSITEIYLNTFLGARIYELASSIHTLAMYYIIEYICIAITFVTFGTKIKSEPLKALRIGIVLNLCLIATIMIAGEDLTSYYIPFAVVLGIAQGAYYSPFAVLVGTYNDNAVKYCTISSVLTNIVNVVFPITIGVYISASSFSAVTICMLVVSSAQIIISIGIENVSVESKCNIRNFFEELKKSKSEKSVYRYYKIGFFNGIVTSVLDRTTLLLIMLVFGSTLELGILGTVFAIFTIITTWFMKKYNKEKAKVLICISAAMPIIAVILLALDTSRETVILYKAIGAVFVCILNLVASIERYDCLDTNLQKEFSTEHQAMSEVVLAFGRVFGLAVLLLLNCLIEGLYAIITMLVLISIAIIAYAYLLIKR